MLISSCQEDPVSRLVICSSIVLLFLFALLATSVQLNKSKPTRQKSSLWTLLVSYKVDFFFNQSHQCHSQLPLMSFSHFSLLLLITTLLMFLYKNIVSIHSQCLEEQQILLLQLRQSLKFNSSQSSKLVLWDSSTDCCSWTGVTYNKGNVIGLDLANESISGGLDNSSSLFNLPYLESLNLAENSFYDTQITSGFENLVNLVYLNLSNSAFVGQIPVEISSLIRKFLISHHFVYVVFVH